MSANYRVPLESGASIGVPLHCSDVIISVMASRLFTQPFVQAQIKQNIKIPRRWPLWGEFTGDRWIPAHKGPVTPKMFLLDDGDGASLSRIP